MRIWYTYVSPILPVLMIILSRYTYVSPIFPMLMIILSRYTYVFPIFPVPMRILSSYTYVFPIFPVLMRILSRNKLLLSPSLSCHIFISVRGPRSTSVFKRKFEHLQRRRFLNYKNRQVD